MTTTFLCMWYNISPDKSKTWRCYRHSRWVMKHDSAEIRPLSLSLFSILLLFFWFYSLVSLKLFIVFHTRAIMSLYYWLLNYTVCCLWCQFVVTNNLLSYSNAKSKSTVRQCPIVSCGGVFHQFSCGTAGSTRVHFVGLIDTPDSNLTGKFCVENKEVKLSTDLSNMQQNVVFTS